MLISNEGDGDFAYGIDCWQRKNGSFYSKVRSMGSPRMDFFGAGCLDVFALDIF